MVLEDRRPSAPVSILNLHVLLWISERYTKPHLDNVHNHCGVSVHLSLHSQGDSELGSNLIPTHRTHGDPGLHAEM